MSQSLAGGLSRSSSVTGENFSRGLGSVTTGMGGASGDRGIIGADREVAPRGIVIAASAVVSVGSGFSPGCTPFPGRMYATICAVVCASSSPGFAGGIFVVIYVNKDSALLPPQLWLKDEPRSALANSPPFRFWPGPEAKLFP